jgi:CPA2 family monovalent cation:H+ antiporter-2
MHEIPLFKDLAIILGVAGVVTLLFRRIRQPVVLGYIVAGTLVGPHTPPGSFLTDPGSLQAWAELGVVFLMFSLGLEFTFHKLMRVGVVAGGTAIFEVLFMVGVGVTVAHVLGWSRTDGWFLGGILAISSTTLILKAIDELHLRSKKFLDLVFGVLVVEDLVAILLLVILTTLSSTAADPGAEFIRSALQLVFVVGSWILVGYFVVPSFFRYAGKHFDDETLTVLAVGLCLVLVAVAVHFGYSAALGAFLMGSILAETGQARRLETLVQPLKHLFSAVFFVSIGMLVNPRQVVELWPVVLVLGALTIVGKFTSTTIGALVFGARPGHAVSAGLSLAQIGEFSFIIAALGASLGVTRPELYPLAVAVSVVTAFTTPYLLRLTPSAERWIDAKLPPRLRRAIDRYDLWIARSSAQSTLRRALFRQGVRFVAGAIATTLVFVGCAFLLWPRLAGWLVDATRAGIITWGLALTLSSPFLWAMAFGSRGDGTGEGSFLVRLAARVATVFWVGFLSRPMLPKGVTLWATAGFTAIVIVASYRSLERWYQWLEKQFLGNITAGKEDESDRLFELAPWDLRLVEATVHPHSELAGESLKEIRPRERFGVNVVAIERSGRALAPPSADDRVLPGDRLLLLGDGEQLESFHDAVADASEQPKAGSELSAFRLFRLLVEPSSPYARKKLRDSGIRAEQGAIVVGLERGGERRMNPGADTVIEEGDVLWLVGERP